MRKHHSSQTRDVFKVMGEMNGNVKVLNRIKKEAHDELAQKKREEVERLWRKMNPIQPSAENDEDFIQKPPVITSAMLFA